MRGYVEMMERLAFDMPEGREPSPMPKYWPRWQINKRSEDRTTRATGAKAKVTCDRPL